jgi:hypothetical protein
MSEDPKVPWSNCKHPAVLCDFQADIQLCTMVWTLQEPYVSDIHQERSSPIVAPVYEQLADAFSTVSPVLARWKLSILHTDEQDKVVIAKTDADGPGRELGNRYGVQGFPSKLLLSDSDYGGVAYKSALKWFPAGSAEPVDYQGGRDLDSLAKL